MNKQEVFNKVATHLISQGKKSITDTGLVNLCVYRSTDGLKCAIGCLIDDSVYNGAMERCTVSSPIIIKALSDSGIDVESIGEYFLDTLQRIHDIGSPLGWLLSLKEFAATYNLNWDCINESI